MPFRLFLKYIDDSFASLIDDHRWPLYVLHILFFLEEVKLVYFMQHSAICKVLDFCIHK